VHLDAGLLSLPYSNRWRAKPLVLKVGLTATLLVLATGPWPWPAPILAGLLAGAIAVGGARVGLQTWLQLLSAPLAFAVLSAGISAWGGQNAWGSVARVFGAASATLLLGTTTPVLDLIAAMQPVRGLQTLAELMFLSYRAITLAGVSGLAMVSAVRVRNLGLGWRQAPSFYGAFAGAVAIRTLEKGRRSEHGLAVRGLEGRMLLLQGEEQP
jgi:cobalt/nickel transport system permease protein